MIFDPLRDGYDGVVDRIIHALVVGFAAGVLTAFGWIGLVLVFSSR